MFLISARQDDKKAIEDSCDCGFIDFGNCGHMWTSNIRAVDLWKLITASHVKGFFPQTVYCWSSILEKKSWPHSLAAPLNSVAGLCVQALSSSCPLWLGLVLFLSSFCPCLGRAPELCGWALWPGSVSGSCPPLVLLVLVLAAPLNSVAGLLWPGFLERSVAEQIAMSMPTKIH